MPKHIVVQVSPYKYIVAEETNPINHSYRYCTKPVSHDIAWFVCQQLNNVDEDQWDGRVKEYML